MNENRFQVHDEDGILRTFSTKVDALAWIGKEEYTLIVIPKARVKRKGNTQDLFKLLGGCLF